MNDEWDDEEFAKYMHRQQKLRVLLQPDYESVLKEEQWELSKAVRYLLGFEDSIEDFFYCYIDQNLSAPEWMKNSLALGKPLYNKIKLAIHNKALPCNGRLHDSSSVFLKTPRHSCQVAPYEIIKWALLEQIPLSISLLCRLRFHQKFNNLDKRNMDCINVQSIALAFWSIDDHLYVADIEEKIENAFPLHDLLSRKYKGDNTLRKWIGKIDPRPKECRVGRKPKGKVRWGSIKVEPIAEAFSRTCHRHPEYDFKALRSTIIASSATLFYGLPSATPLSVFEHPVIQAYIDPSPILVSEFLKQLIFEWVEEGHQWIVKKLK